MKILDVCCGRLHKIAYIHESDFMVIDEILPSASCPEGRQWRGTYSL